MIKYHGVAAAWQLTYTICVVLWVLILREAYRKCIPYIRAALYHIKSALREVRTHTRRKEKLLSKLYQKLGGNAMQSQTIVSSVDNYMLVNRDYERQAPAKHHQCTCCGRCFFQGELTTYKDDEVCEDCEMDYLLKAGANMHTAFMLENRKDAATTWFYKWLKPGEQDLLLLSLFTAALTSGSACMTEFQEEYCTTHECFPEFVGGKLNGK